MGKWSVEFVYKEGCKFVAHSEEVYGVILPHNTIDLVRVSYHEIDDPNIKTIEEELTKKYVGKPYSVLLGDFSPSIEKMKSNELYWIDENGNKWTKASYTKEQAEELSKTLIYCKDCINCSDCTNCSYCTDCKFCSHCSGCLSCSECFYCSSCLECSNSNHCFDCSNCSYCKNCSKISSFKDNPQRLVSDRIGSRRDQTTTYFDTKRIQVICGCFKGTLNQFKKRVKSVHGDNEFGKEYQEYIKQVETLIKQSK